MYYLNQITYKYKTAESNNGKLDIIHMSNIPIKIPINKEGNIDMEFQNNVVETYDKIIKRKNDIKEIIFEIDKVIK